MWLGVFGLGVIGVFWGGLLLWGVCGVICYVGGGGGEGRCCCWGWEGVIMKGSMR